MASFTCTSVTNAGESIRVPVCVGVCMGLCGHTHTHTHTHIYIYTVFMHLVTICSWEGWMSKYLMICASIII